MMHSMRVLAAMDFVFRREAEMDRPLTWDEIGERHPHVYGDPEIHGDAARDADGEGIGYGAAHLAYDRPGHPGENEEHSVYDLSFRLEDVPTNKIDYAHHGGDDPRVIRARRWYRDSPDDVVPPVLVHRHGVYQVADGHHRGEGASLEGLSSIPAYVAQSPHEDEPFSDGARGPYHGAEPVQKQASEHVPFRIEHSSRGSYTPRWVPGSGDPGPTQHYHTYRAWTPDGEPAGHMDFSTISYPEGDHEAHIEWVEAQHKGAASAMMDKLYTEHPDHEVHHGYQTDQGAPFIERWMESHPEHADRSHFGGIE